MKSFFVGLIIVNKYSHLYDGVLNIQTKHLNMCILYEFPSMLIRFQFVKRDLFHQVSNALIPKIFENLSTISLFHESDGCFLALSIGFNLSRIVPTS